MLTEHVGGGCMSFHSTDPRIGLQDFVAIEVSRPPI
jgi:hypothetical protein